jgi:PAS domain S-box-containing protein
MQSLQDYIMNEQEQHINAQAFFISRVIDASPDAIHIVNIQSGTTVYINRMLLEELGYTPEDIRTRQLEKKIVELYHSDDVEKLSTFRSDIARAGDDEIVEMEARIKSRTGHWQWIKTRAKIFQRDDEGVPLKYIAFAQNITAKKAIDEERKQNSILQELSRAKTEFFANVTHELKTPLSLLMGPLEDLLKNSKNLSADQVHKLQMMERNTYRLQKLINTQLDFSRIEAGRMEAVFQPTDIARYTEDLASNFRSTIESAGLKFIVRCNNVADPIYLSREMWEKIVLNLISNAFKFTLKGKIEVILKENKKHVRLNVRDTGSGIANDNIPLIFERFHRIENGKSRAYEGSGIGLALVKELVTLHGGTIRVSSTLGKGSDFMVVLPKGKSHLPPRQIFESNTYRNGSEAKNFIEQAAGWLNDPVKRGRKKANGGLSPSGDPKPTILVADDNLDMRAYFNALLSEDYNVIDADNGVDALQEIGNNHVDLVVADIMMPAPNGLQLLELLKADKRTASIPVLIVSAISNDDSKNDALRKGAEDYLAKPFASKVLKDRISALLEKFKRRHQEASSPANA